MTTTVTNTLVDAAGQPVAGIAVTATLVPSVAFSSDGTEEIVQAASTTSDADGSWSLALTPQSGITPDGSYYVVQEGTRRYTITVPDAGPVTLFDSLATPVPADTGLTSALTEAAADNRYVKLTDGVPDGTITNVKVADDASIELSKLAVDPLARANHTGTQTSATISDFTSAVGALVPDPLMSGGMIPDGHGYALWTFDPAIASTEFSIASGSLICIRCYVPVDMTVSAVDVAVTFAGTTPGAYSGVGLFSDAGMLLSKSADAGAQFTTTGVKTIQLGASQTLTAGTYIWLAVLWQGSTSPKIAASTAVVEDFVLNVGVRRAVFTDNQTTIPASFTPAGANLNNAIHWLAAS